MKKQRNTVQRGIILNALLKLNDHPTVDGVYAAIHGDHPAISRSTVYRNLRQLAEAGVIRQVALPDGPERYDGRSCRHQHFLCRSCGGIMDVEIEYTERLDEAVREKYGARVDSHDIVFSGLCSECARNKR